MSSWYTILYLIGAVLLAWFAYRTMKNNPAMFSAENMGKSFFTMGVLALVLIAFVALLVVLLKQ